MAQHACPPAPSTVARDALQSLSAPTGSVVLSPSPVVLNVWGCVRPQQPSLMTCYLCDQPQQQRGRLGDRWSHQNVIVLCPGCSPLVSFQCCRGNIFSSSDFWKVTSDSSSGCSGISSFMAVYIQRWHTWKSPVTFSYKWCCGWMVQAITVQFAPRERLKATFAT